MQKKEILILFASTFIIVLVWIIFNVYHNSVKSTISEKLNFQIQDIDPGFDNQTLEELKQRKKVVPLFEFESSTSSSATSILDIVENPEILPTLEPTPTSREEGSLENE